MRSLVGMIGVAVLCLGPAMAEERADPRCALHGPGFHFAEAIASCVRVSGSIEFDAGISNGRGVSGTRAGAAIDVRRDTEFGPLQVVIGTNRPLN